MYNGFAGTFVGSNNVFLFAGPVAIVTTNATQRLVGAAEAPLALGSGANQSFDYGLCYQVGAGPLTNFAGGNYSTGTITTTRASYPAAASVTPGAGTYNVGFCVRNYGAAAITNNDFVNGWVQVVNAGSSDLAISHVSPRRHK